MPLVVSHVEAVRAAAKEQRRVGVVVLPLVYRQKRPSLAIWEQYQQTPPTAAESAGWFTTERLLNLGAICGRVSGNLVVLVFNHQGVYQACFAGEDISRQTWVAQSKRGPHVYVRTTGLLPPTHYYDHPDCPSALEVRADGAYVVAPPSIHPSGLRYTWRGERPDQILVVEDFDAWLRKRLDRADRLGWPLARRAAGQATTSCTNADSELLLGEKTRNLGLTSLGGLLRRRGLGEAALADCLLAINRAHCRPPLPESEVRHIARSLVRYAPTVPENSGGPTHLRVEVA
jgi:hypothetical protein